MKIRIALATLALAFTAALSSPAQAASKQTAAVIGYLADFLK